MQLSKPVEIDKNFAEIRINQLRLLIIRHNRLYYENTPPRPEISDQEYEEREAELLERLTMAREAHTV